ncbi:MAG: benzoate/H(+) symporter BenE family transporter [Ilumatobacteraceae bacterium]
MKGPLPTEPRPARHGLASHVSAHLGPLIAGALVILVGYSGPMLLVREAARAAGLSERLADSWVFTVSFGPGVAGLLLSWRLKQPVIVAFSTAGVVLLTSSLGQYAFSDAIGAYLLVGVACVAIGWSSSFSAVMARVPLDRLGDARRHPAPVRDWLLRRFPAGEPRTAGSR